MDGFKYGRSVSKEHYLCPWNTSIFYGEVSEKIKSGCYYNCSIDKAKFLSSDELKKILTWFKMHLTNGDQDNLGQIKPLLTDKERISIENRIRKEIRVREKQKKLECSIRIKRASAIIAKHPEYAYLLGIYYGEKTFVSVDDGIIDFDPEGYKQIFGAEKFTYDEYLDVQIRSLGKYRKSFADCYFNYPSDFMGQIERITDKYVCFK